MLSTLALISTPARALPAAPPASQTLEALHGGGAVAMPSEFFDGMSARVHTLVPISYEDLPRLPPASKPALIAPAPAAAAPVRAAEKPVASRNSGAPSMGGGLVAGAGVAAVAAGVFLLHGAAAGGVIGLGAALLVVGLVLLARR